MRRAKLGILVLVLVVAVSCVAWLLLQEPWGPRSGSVDRTTPARDAQAELGGEVGQARLAAAPGARRAADAAAAAAHAPKPPSFPRSLGVFGRVVDGRQQPVARATVKAFPVPPTGSVWGRPDGEPVATAETDAQGEYVVGPLPVGSIRLRAEAEGYAPSVAVARRRGYRVDLVLDRGGRLEVVVENADGRPLEKARVLVVAGRSGGRPSGWSAVVTEAHTDENGRADFASLPTGPATICVSCEGYAALVQGNLSIAPGPGETRTVVLSKPVTVMGRVLDRSTRRAIAHAAVKAHFDRMPWLGDVGPWETDADGHFEFQSPAELEQNLKLEVTVPDRPPVESFYPVTRLGDDRSSVEVLIGSETSQVRGEVRGPQGLPAGGVRVTFAQAMNDPDVGATTRTDGSFTLDVPAVLDHPGSSGQVVATSDTLGMGVGVAKIPGKGELGEPVVITLGGAGTVTGHVTDAQGAPVEGALVTLDLDWSGTMKRARQGGRNPWMFMAFLTQGRGQDAAAVSDAGGAFTIAGVPCASYLLHATYGLQSSVSTDPLEVESSATVTRDVMLGEGQTIEGRVEDQQGDPVAGAQVWAYTQRGSGPGPGFASRMSARTQSDGHFVLYGATADQYQIRVWATGYQMKEQPTVASGTKDLKIVLTTLGSIQGVVSYQGRPYAGTFQVSALPVGDTNDARRAWRGGSTESTFSTDDGHYVLGNLQAGSYDVSARTPDGLVSPEAVRVEVREEATAEASLVLVGGGRVVGTLVNAETGLPVGGAHLSVRAAKGGGGAAPMSGSGATDAEGRFELRGLPGGSFVLDVSPPDGIHFYEPFDLAPGEVRTLRLEEKKPGSIRVVVVDDSGNPVEGATPQVVNGIGVFTWPNWTALQRSGVAMTAQTWSRVLRTDGNGVNVRRFLPPGRYTVTAVHEGYEKAPALEVEVASGAESEVRIVLQRTP